MSNCCSIVLLGSPHVLPSQDGPHLPCNMQHPGVCHLAASMQWYTSRKLGSLHLCLCFDTRIRSRVLQGINHVPPLEQLHQRKHLLTGIPQASVGMQIRPNIPPAEPYEARTCCGGPMEGLKAMLKQQV